jgi:hypothetical protein
MRARPAPDVGKAIFRYGDEAMTDPINYRMERIERLLYELRHEVTRGMIEGEIDEHLGYSFIVPSSKKIPDGMVRCEFRARPVQRGSCHMDDCEPRLRLIKS